MTLQDSYMWSRDAMKHMEQYTSDGLDTDAQVSYAIAYQTIRCFNNALQSCLQLAQSAEQEYEEFLRSSYPLRESVELDDDIL